ncbi:TomO hydrophobic C-terminal domain-containing protein [Wolbachia endosymbiont of Dactylopius coccus]|nr:MAG: hypothetical protein TV42_04915 [Wolbachia endosymbiont of Dactylopius coccus]
MKEILKKLVNYNELSEELVNMCKFLEESEALIEQLIDKQVGDLNKALSAHHCIKFSILNENFSYNAKRRVFVTDQGDELSKYFKEILYDQVKKAKEFSEELSKKNKDLKMEDLSLGCNSLDNTTGSNAQGDSSKAHSKVIVTESNGSDGENKKTIQNLISHNSREGKMPTNTKQRVKSSSEQEKSENTRNQLEKLQKELNEKTQALESMKTQLAEKEEELKGVQVQLEQEKTKLQDELKKKEKELNSKTREVTELTEEKSQLEKKRNSIQQDLVEKTKALNSTQAQLEKLQQESVGKANEVTNLTEQLKNTKAQAEEEINKLNGQIDQLTQEKNQLDEQLDSVQKELGIRISEVTQLTAENTQLKDNLKTTTEKNTKLQNDLEVTQKIVNEKDSQIGNLNSNIIELNEQLRNKDSHIEGLNDQLKSNDVRVKELNNTHGQLENKSKLENQIKELSCKNQKLSKASTHSKRQSNYASVSFVLSGVFAVGASLTMFHLVICISLAVAALTFLAVGFYCSYKANTALSNVEVKNGVDPIAVEV